MKILYKINNTTKKDLIVPDNLVGALFWCGQLGCQGCLVPGTKEVRLLLVLNFVAHSFLHLCAKYCFFFFVTKIKRMLLNCI